MDKDLNLQTSNKNIKGVEVAPFAVDWADSTTLQKTPDGNLIEVGTVLLINNFIAYLKFYNNEQLEALKKNVNEAVNHELNKRSEK